MEDFEARVGGEDIHPPTTIRKVALASFIGSVMEWYDFFIFATASALVLPTRPVRRAAHEGRRLPGARAGVVHSRAALTGRGSVARIAMEIASCHSPSQWSASRWTPSRTNPHFSYVRSARGLNA